MFDREGQRTKSKSQKELDFWLFLMVGEIWELMIGKNDY